MKYVLVTGGAGYIGSHTVLELQEQGYEVLVFDNFDNSKPEVLRRVAALSGVAPVFVEGDLLGREAIKNVFDKYQIESVIHFAGLKAVGESVALPLKYYQTNLVSTLNLLDAMKQHGCNQLVFSSSSTVYGNPHTTPICEDFPLSATNPYGQTKLLIENMLRDLARLDGVWNFSILRYFNPVGAHQSGMIGEDPQGTPNNLMPYISQVAVGKLKQLAVFGDDYDTTDGTGVRDYIHVVDLALAHISALKSLTKKRISRCVEYNIGTGKGYSVLEMIHAFEKASGTDIPYSIEPRRSGDIDKCYANPEFSYRELGWKTKYNLDEMMEDQWRWQKNNPNGYE